MKALLFEAFKKKKNSTSISLKLKTKKQQLKSPTYSESTFCVYFKCKEFTSKYLLTASEKVSIKAKICI